MDITGTSTSVKLADVPKLLNLNVNAYRLVHNLQPTPNPTNLVYFLLLSMERSTGIVPSRTYREMNHRY